MVILMSWLLSELQLLLWSFSTTVVKIILHSFDVVRGFSSVEVFKIVAHLVTILDFIVLLLWNGTFTGIHCIFYVLLQHKLPIGTNKLETWTWNLIKANHLNIWVIYLQLTTEVFLLHDGLREKSVVHGRSKTEFYGEKQGLIPWTLLSCTSGGL